MRVRCPQCLAPTYSPRWTEKWLKVCPFLLNPGRCTSAHLPCQLARLSGPQGPASLCQTPVSARFQLNLRGNLGHLSALHLLQLTCASCPPILGPGFSSIPSLTRVPLPPSVQGQRPLVSRTLSLSCRRVSGPLPCPPLPWLPFQHPFVLNTRLLLETPAFLDFRHLVT